MNLCSYCQLQEYLKEASKTYSRVVTRHGDGCTDLFIIPFGEIIPKNARRIYERDTIQILGYRK